MFDPRMITRFKFLRFDLRKLNEPISEIFPSAVKCSSVSDSSSIASFGMERSQFAYKLMSSSFVKLKNMP